MNIIQKISFDIDKNVSVFETNIRIVGGLLSTHLLYKKKRFDGSEYFKSIVIYFLNATFTKLMLYLLIA